MTAADDLRDRYRAAMHAMQTGVKLLLTRRAPGYEIDGTVPDSHECSPKHLRVGVNSALLDSGALQMVLIKKGLITQEEYLAALCELLEADVESYRTKLGLPPNVSLG